MKYIYRDKVLQLLKNLLKDAYELRLLFNKAESVETLSVSFKNITNRFQELEKIVPPDFRTDSSLKGHIGFIKYYLNKKQPDNCQGDIIEICDRDIDLFELDYIKYVNTRFVDSELANNIISLVDSNNYDSAVRKASLTLTERLRSKFNMASDKDGKELVNDIFGQKGKLAEVMSKDKREAYRDFFSGIYGLVRNEYMHNLKIPDNIEAEYILNIINFALLRIDEINAC